MKKHIFFIAIAMFLCIHTFSQEVTHKLLIGASVSYGEEHHLNYSANSLSLVTRNADILCEAGFYLSTRSLIGLEAGYYLDRMTHEADFSDQILNTDERESGFILAPKFRLIRPFSDRFQFYTDLKAVMKFSKIRNDYEGQYSNQTIRELTKGNLFIYGLSVDPGIIFKFTNTFGLKLEYPLLYISHNSLKPADDSDVQFKDQDETDYGLNMNISDIRFGAVFTF